MKRLFIVAATLSALWSASAADFVVGGVKYTTTSATACTVAGLDDTSLKEIIIPESVTSDGTTYTITAVAASAFYKTNLTGITLPETVTTLGTKAFSECPLLTHINIPSKVTSIPTDLCSECSQLTEITIPAGVTSIGTRAFASCTKLTQVNIPNDSKLQTLGEYSFSGDRFTSFFIPAGLRSIGNGALANNTKFQEIIVDPANTNYASFDKCLYNAAKTRLIVMPGAKSSIEFPPTITTFGAGCCKGSNLKSLTIPDGVITIEADAVGWCSSLTELNFGNTVQTIGEAAFYNCYGLTSFDLPASIKRLDTRSLDAHTLQKMTCHATTPPTASNIFSYHPNLYNTVSLEVPKASLEAYKAAETWKRFVKISPIYEAPVAGANSATITGMVTPNIIPWSQMISLVFKVQNEGTEAITSLGGVLKIDGDAYPEQTISGLNIPSGEEQEVTLTIPLNIAKYEMELTITKVNGVDNENSVPTFKFDLETYDVTLPAGSPEATYADFINTQYLGWGGCKSVIGAIKFVDSNLTGTKVIGAKVIGIHGKEVKNVKIWSSSVLSTTPDNESMYANVVNDVATTKFTKPVVLPQGGYYFGISLDIDSVNRNDFPLPVSKNKPNEYSFYLSHDGGTFTNYSEEYGSLQMILIFDKEGFPQSKLLPVAGEGGFAAMAGKNFSVPVNVVNYTGEEVTKITYTCTGHGKTYTGTSTDTIKAFATALQPISLPMEAISTPGNYELVLSLSTMNDKVNSWANKSLTVPFSIATFETTHHPIMEEMTGTECGWCPRGILGMAELAKTYPDFIGAAYHRYNSTDPMIPSNNGPFTSRDAPKAIMDRTIYDLDPFFGTNGKSMGIAADYESLRARLAPANLGLETWWNADSTQISAKAKAEFSYVEKDGQYRIGYLLTVDGVHGEGAAWKQSNFYYGDKNSNPLLETLCDGTFDVNIFNHVVFDLSAAKGVYNCTGAKPGSQFENTRTFALSEATLLSPEWLTDPANCSKKDMNVIVLLIDQKGRVRNALQVRAGKSSELATGVEAVATDPNLPIIYYDLQGRRVAQPQHGIFIKVQGSKATKVAL